MFMFSWCNILRVRLCILPTVVFGEKDAACYLHIVFYFWDQWSLQFQVLNVLMFRSGVLMRVEQLPRV